jgi:hypothetical protein
MTTEQIIDLLIERETDYLKIKSFSKLPGVYAIFYIGNSFPVFGDSVKKHQIIYIGKTESSQEKRDAKTHFTTGKTGSSTVRKSIGSLLNVNESLTPIPRNESDYLKGRYSHFKFDLKSEETITSWMKNNLALAFYEFPESKMLIDILETEVIQKLQPILNIDHKNPNNPYKNEIRKLRKDCAIIASKNNASLSSQSKEKVISKTKTVNKASAKSGKGEIFIDNITESDVKSKKIRIKVENKHLFPDEEIGKPVTYSLNFKAGVIPFIANYTIGSNDGKSRSAILKLNDKIYNEILKIKPGIKLKVERIKDNIFNIDRA